VHVTCRNTFLVSNLLRYPVALQSLNAQGPASHRLLIDSNDSQPIDAEWLAVSDDSCAPDAAVSTADSRPLSATTYMPETVSGSDDLSRTPQATTWPCVVSLSIPGSPRLTSCLRSSRDETSSTTWDEDKRGPSSSPAAVVSMAQPCRRRWLTLPTVDKGHSCVPRQVAYRLLRKGGRHHLVLFEDMQPQLRLVNATGDAAHQSLITSLLLPRFLVCSIQRADQA
jgi:hypothetical protein